MPRRTRLDLLYLLGGACQCNSQARRRSLSAFTMEHGLTGPGAVAIMTNWTLRIGGQALPEFCKIHVVLQMQVRLLHAWSEERCKIRDCAREVTTFSRRRWQASGLFLSSQGHVVGESGKGLVGLASQHVDLGRPTRPT